MCWRDDGSATAKDDKSDALGMESEVDCEDDEYCEITVYDATGKKIVLSWLQKFIGPHPDQGKNDIDDDGRPFKFTNRIVSSSGQGYYLHFDMKAVWYEKNEEGVYVKRQRLIGRSSFEIPDGFHIYGMSSVAAGRHVGYAEVDPDDENKFLAIVFEHWTTKTGAETPHSSRVIINRDYEHDTASDAADNLEAHRNEEVMDLSFATCPSIDFCNRRGATDAVEKMLLAVKVCERDTAEEREEREEARKRKREEREEARKRKREEVSAKHHLSCLVCCHLSLSQIVITLCRRRR